MIETENINPFLLPSVLLHKRFMLPPHSGVYFVLADTEKIVYIGKAKSLAARWIEHHKIKQIETLNHVRIAWLACKGVSTENLYRIEQECIFRFKPPLNSIGKKHPVDSRLSQQQKRREERYRQNTVPWTGGKYIEAQKGI